MCGIAGFYRMGKTPIRDWQVAIAANKLEYRGNDATGVVLMDTKGKIRYHKNNDPAWKFTASKEYKRFIAEHLNEDTQIVLVHTRKYTKGTPFKNENNHPMIADAGAVVHNGMISNDDGLFLANKGKRGWKRSCETDSDAIRAILDCSGGVTKETIADMNLLNGVAAVLAVHPATPGKLLLLRDQNPLVIGATKDIVMFASDKLTIHAAMKPWVKMHNIWLQVHAPDISFLPMPNQSGWVWGPGGFEEHAEFKANGVMNRGNTKHYPNTTYHERRQRAALEAVRTVPQLPEKVHANPVHTHNPTTKGTLSSGIPKFVVCPSEKCNIPLELDDFDRQVSSLAMLACGTCGTNLADAAGVHAEQLVH